MEALETIVEAVQVSGQKLGETIKIGLDVAASEFLTNKKMFMR